MSRVRIPSIAHSFLTPPINVTIFEAIILGIVQGLTEFLPISSSGHLELGQVLLGMQNLHLYVFFDLVCHLGTLLAIFLVFREQILEIIKTNHKKLLQVILATTPLIPLVFILHPIKSLFNQPQYLGFAFLFTALLLFIGTNADRLIKTKLIKNKWGESFVVGVFQAIAIIPGISRSGSTISSGLMLGWQAKDAATFSFLLAIPAILGGCVIEILDYTLHPTEIASVSFLQYFIGFLFSFIIGYFSLLLVIKLTVTKRISGFAWYCLILGLSTLFYFNFVHYS